MTRLINSLIKSKVPTLYMNKHNYLYLSPLEMVSIDKLLSFLYDNRGKRINLNDIMNYSLVKNRFTMQATVYKLMPYFIDIRSAKITQNYKSARFVKINNNGIAVVEEWRRHKNEIHPSD